MRYVNLYDKIIMMTTKLYSNYINIVIKLINFFFKYYFFSNNSKRKEKTKGEKLTTFSLCVKL